MHECVELMDDKKLEGLYLLVADEFNSQNVSLSKEQIDFLNKERAMYMNGEDQSYSWEEAKEIIRKKYDL